MMAAHDARRFPSLCSLICRAALLNIFCSIVRVKSSGHSQSHLSPWQRHRKEEDMPWINNSIGAWLAPLPGSCPTTRAGSSCFACGAPPLKSQRTLRSSSNPQLPTSLPQQQLGHSASSVVDAELLSHLRPTCTRCRVPGAAPAHHHAQHDRWFKSAPARMPRGEMSVLIIEAAISKRCARMVQASDVGAGLQGSKAATMQQAPLGPQAAMLNKLPRRAHTRAATALLMLGIMVGHRPQAAHGMPASAMRWAV